MLFFLVKIETSERHTATDLVNLLFIRPVSSDQTDFIRDLKSLAPKLN